MKVLVQINDEVLTVECGTGRNKITWLCNSAFHRYDQNYGLDSGLWSSVEDESGNKLIPDAVIADKIEDGGKVILKFEEIKVEEEKTAKATPVPAPAKKK